MFFPCGKVYHKMGIWWKKSTCMLWKKWVPIPQAVPIWWILLQFLMLWEIDRETHGYESNGKKAPILCEKYEYQFPRFSTYDGSCKIFPETNFPGFSHLMSFSAISYAMGNDEKTHAFPIWWSIPQDGNLIEKTTHFMEKVWEPISQAFPIWWVLLTFLMLWEIWWDNPCIFHAMKYTIGWKSNGKKAPILWQNYEYQFPMFSIYNGFCWILLGTNFPGFPHSVGLAVFSCIMGNWLENTCISHVMKYTIKWESNEKTASIQWENHEYQFPRLSPIWWILLHFPVLWKIDREAHAFSIWWSIW